MKNGGLGLDDQKFWPDGNSSPAILSIHIFGTGLGSPDQWKLTRRIEKRTAGPLLQLSVQGIWKATLGEKEIVMAMNQSGQSIFGLAKFEGEDPWNAALAGSLSQMRFPFPWPHGGRGAAATYISATLEGDTMKGFFIRSDSNGKASRGISPLHDQPGYIQLHPGRSDRRPLPAAQTEPESTAERRRRAKSCQSLTRSRRRRADSRMSPTGQGNQSQHLAQDGSTLGGIDERQILGKALLSRPGPLADHAGTGLLDGRIGHHFAPLRTATSGMSASTGRRWMIT